MVLYLKAAHLISMVAWFAGMFYIFRLYLYHVKFSHEPVLAETYQMMEKRLLKIICWPAMVLTLLFGFSLIWKNPGVLTARWFHIKFMLVLMLIGYQVFAEHVYREFKKKNIFLSEAACRIINEIPTVMLIGIVFLAVVKPL